MQLLTEIRIRNKLTKAALARKAEVDRTTVWRAERGKPIGEITQERIAQALNIDRRVLFPPDLEAAS